MSTLKALTTRLRTSLFAEAAKSGVKAAQPSTDIPGDALKAANGFRDAVKSGDDLEAAAAKVAEASKAASLADGGIEAKRAAMDVESACVKMKQAVDSIYGPFAEARQAFYSIALAWDMYKTQPSTGKKSSSVDIKTQTDKEIADMIGFTAKGLGPSVKDFLEKSARAQKLLRDAAKKVGLENKELSDSEKKAIIDACFAAKTSADPLFGRTQGINRRAVELVARARAKEKYEAKAKGIEIRLAVEDDPELGGFEIA
jgi:hypothetical protein